MWRDVVDFKYHSETSRMSLQGRSLPTDSFGLGRVLGVVLRDIQCTSVKQR